MVCVSRSLACVGVGDLRVFLPELPKYICVYIFIAKGTYVYKKNCIPFL